MDGKYRQVGVYAHVVQSLAFTHASLEHGMVLWVHARLNRSSDRVAKGLQLLAKCGPSPCTDWVILDGIWVSCESIKCIQFDPSHTSSVVGGLVGRGVPHGAEEVLYLLCSWVLCTESWALPDVN